MSDTARAAAAQHQANASAARRGVRDAETKMVNSVMRGSFLKDAALRREFLSLINLKN